MAGLLNLIQGDGFTLIRQAATGGGEWAGPCPFCGGKDRFRVWPESGRFWCRGCGKTGDEIQYLRESRGLSFRDACNFIGHNPYVKFNKTRRTPIIWVPREATTPPGLWREKASDFLDRAVACLWSKRGNKLVEWLRNEKGLSDSSIKMARLGMNPVDLFETRQSWGLDASIREDGKARRQWIPAGLVIPLCIRSAVHRLRIRRMESVAHQKYIIVSGSSSAPMAWGLDKKAAVIIESELDGVLLSQEVDDLVSVIAIGSAPAKLDKITHEKLTKAEIILVALDSDEAGARASRNFWLTTYGKRAKRWPCVNGKDPSEARLNGLNLRAWIVAGCAL